MKSRLNIIKCALICLGLTLANSGVSAAQEAIIPLRVTASQSPIIILWTGDGGWHSDLDVKMAEQFAAQGYDVVGLDTNVWFEKLKTETEVASKLAAMLAQYAKPAGRKVILLGWSYGADVLPIAYNRLLAADQKMVSAIVLLAGSNLTQLQVTLSERMGLTPGNIVLDPELARLPRPKFLCVYGDRTKAETNCLSEGAKGAVITELPGDHFFDHKAAEVVTALIPLIHKAGTAP